MPKIKSAKTGKVYDIPDSIAVSDDAIDKYVSEQDTFPSEVTLRMPPAESSDKKPYWKESLDVLKGEAKGFGKGALGLGQAFFDSANPDPEKKVAQGQALYEGVKRAFGSPSTIPVTAVEQLGVPVTSFRKGMSEGNTNDIGESIGEGLFALSLLGIGAKPKSPAVGRLNRVVASDRAAGYSPIESVPEIIPPTPITPITDPSRLLPAQATRSPRLYSGREGLADSTTPYMSDLGPSPIQRPNLSPTVGPSTGYGGKVFSGSSDYIPPSGDTATIPPSQYGEMIQLPPIIAAEKGVALGRPATYLSDLEKFNARSLPKSYADVDLIDRPKPVENRGARITDDQLRNAEVIRHKLEARRQGLQPVQDITAAPETALNRVRPEKPDYANRVLGQVKSGNPGLADETRPSSIPALGDIREIIYRDPNGKPIAVARLIKDSNGKLLVEDFAADKTKGLLYGRATIAVGKKLQELGATTPAGTITPDVVKLMEKSSKVKISKSERKVQDEIDKKSRLDKLIETAKSKGIDISKFIKEDKATLDTDKLLDAISKVVDEAKKVDIPRIAAIGKDISGEIRDSKLDRTQRSPLDILKNEKGAVGKDINQATQTGPNGETLKRWRAILANGKSVATWAVDEAAARDKIIKTRGQEIKDITPATDAISEGNTPLAKMLKRSLGNEKGGVSLNPKTSNIDEIIVGVDSPNGGVQSKRIPFIEDVEHGDLFPNHVSPSDKRFRYFKKTGKLVFTDYPDSNIFFRVLDHIENMGDKVSTVKVSGFYSSAQPVSDVIKFYLKNQDSSLFMNEPPILSRLKRSLGNEKGEISLRTRKPGSPTLKDKFSQGLSDVKRVYEDVAQSGITTIRKSGEAGKELVNTILRNRLDSDIRAGRWNDRIRESIKHLSKSETENLIEVMDKQATPINSKVAKAYKDYLQIDFERTYQAVDSGIGMKRGKKIIPFQERAGYFPRIYEPGFFKGHKDAFDALIKEGKSPKEAELILKKSKEYGERLIDPLHSRQTDTPGYRKDIDAVYQHNNEMARRIQQANDFGPLDTADKGSPISRMIAATDNPGRVSEIVKRYLGREKPMNPSWARVNQAVTGFEAFTKLSQFVISNTATLGMIPIRAGFKSTGKAFRDLALDYKKSMRIAERTGARQPVLQEIVREFGGNKGTSKWYGIQFSEDLNRSLSAIAGKYEARDLFSELKSKPNNKRVRRQIENLTLEKADDLLKQRELTEWQTDRAGGRMSEITQGRASNIDLPPEWSERPAAKLVFLYKRFAFAQTKSIMEAIKDNPVKTTAIIAGLFPLIGEAIGDTKASIKSATLSVMQDKDLRKAIDEAIAGRGKGLERYVNNLSQAWAIGMLGELGTSIRRNPSGLTEWAAGPVMSDLSKTAYNVATGNPRKLAKQVVESIPVIGRGLAQDRMFITPTKKKASPYSMPR